MRSGRKCSINPQRAGSAAGSGWTEAVTAGRWAPPPLRPRGSDRRLFWSLFCAAAAQALLAAAVLAGAQPLISEPLTDRVYSPQLSPGGRFLAYEIQQGNSRLVEIRDLAGGAKMKAPMSQEKMMSKKGYQGQVCWRPLAPGASRDAALMFAFVRGREENPDVCIGRIDPVEGKIQVEQLTTEPSLDYFPRFSPDGRWMVFLSNRDRDRGADIFLLGPLTEGGALAPGAGTYRITRGARSSLFPQWSPDGKAIVFSAESDQEGPATSYLFGILLPDLNALPPNGKDLSSELQPVRLPVGGDLPLKIPSWSFDGKYLACYTRRGSAEAASEPEQRKGSGMDGKGAAHEPNGIAVLSLGAGSALFSDAKFVVKDLGFPVADLMESSYSVGPVWIPGAHRIATMERDSLQDFPIVEYDVTRQGVKTRYTDTKINRDVAACESKQGIALIYTAHQGQTVNIFLRLVEGGR